MIFRTNKEEYTIHKPCVEGKFKFFRIILKTIFSNKKEKYRILVLMRKSLILHHVFYNILDQIRSLMVRMALVRLGMTLVSNSWNESVDRLSIWVLSFNKCCLLNSGFNSFLEGDVDIGRFHIKVIFTKFSQTIIAAEYEPKKFKSLY